MHSLDRSQKPGRVERVPCTCHDALRWSSGMQVRTNWLHSRAAVVVRLHDTGRLGEPCSARLGTVKWRNLQNEKLNLRSELMFFLDRTALIMANWRFLSPGTSRCVVKESTERDVRLPQRCQWDIRSCAMLRSIDWWSVTDVSGQHVGPIFKGPAVQEDCLTDRLSRNFAVYQSTSRDIRQERGSQTSTSASEDSTACCFTDGRFLRNSGNCVPVYLTERWHKSEG